MTAAEREATTRRNMLIRRGMALASKALGNLDKTGRDELARVYRAASLEIGQAILARAEADGSLALVQLRALLSQIEARLDQLVVQRNVLLNDGLRVAAELGVQPFLMVTVGAETLMRVPDEAVRFVQGFVAADGLQLSDRLWRIDRGARDAVVNAVERSVVMGQSASQAAREFLNRGQAVPFDVQQKLNASGAIGVSKETAAIMTGDRSGGGAMAQAQRVFRTEINRAHGVAYMTQAEKTPGFIGFQFTLSPAHPEPDICDDLAAADKFGLGKGMYPSMAEFLKIWPAHPNTLSAPVGKFEEPPA